VAEAARAARTRVWAVRSGDAFRSEARHVVYKHASRKDGSGQFVNDRAPKRRASAAKVVDARQLGFEF
jgi:deoxyribodipyrimidine photo-lyase